MFLLFFFSFIAAHFMLFATAIESLSVNSGLSDQFGSSRIARRARRDTLRKHWLITALLFAAEIYAGLNLY